MYPPCHKGQTQTSTHNIVRQRKSSRNDVKAERNKHKQSGACTKDQGTTYLYTTNTGEVGHRLMYSKGVV